MKSSVLGAVFCHHQTPRRSAFLHLLRLLIRKMNMLATQGGARIKLKSYREDLEKLSLPRKMVTAFLALILSSESPRVKANQPFIQSLSTMPEDEVSDWRRGSLYTVGHRFVLPMPGRRWPHVTPYWNKWKVGSPLIHKPELGESLPCILF